MGQLIKDVCSLRAVAQRGKCHGVGSGGEPRAANRGQRQGEADGKEVSCLYGSSSHAELEGEEIRSC